MKHFKLPKYHPARMHQSFDRPEPSLQTKKYRSDELLLGFMIEFPRMSQLFLQHLHEELFGDELKAIYKAFSAYYNRQGLEESAPGFMGSLDRELADIAALLSLYIAERYGEIGEEAVEMEMKVLVDNVRKSYSGKKKRELQVKIVEAEKNNDKELREKLLEELNGLYIL